MAEQVSLATQIYPWTRGLRYGSGSTTYPTASTTPTIVEPVTVDQAPNAELNCIITPATAVNCYASFFGGLDSVADTFKVRIVGWSSCEGSATEPPPVVPRLPKATTLWIPTVLGEITATLGTRAGIANAAVGSTELFCTILAVTANSYSGIAVFSANALLANAIAFATIPTLGFQKLGFYFDLTGSVSSSSSSSSGDAYLGPTANMIYRYG